MAIVLTRSTGVSPTLGVASSLAESCAASLQTSAKSYLRKNSRLQPCSKTHSKPCRPIPALLAKRSTLAFSILRAIIAVGNWDTMRARCRNSVAGASPPWDEGYGVYVIYSRQDLKCQQSMAKKSLHGVCCLRLETYTYCARLRFIDMHVAEGPSGPSGSEKTISRTYAVSGRLKSCTDKPHPCESPVPSAVPRLTFVIHFGAPCCTPMILSVRMMPVLGSIVLAIVSTL